MRAPRRAFLSTSLCANNFISATHVPYLETIENLNVKKPRIGVVPVRGFGLNPRPL